MSQSARTLIGRGRELNELEGGLDEAQGGVGGLFVLVGEPGVGKTRLADEIGRRAKGRGFTVHWGRCWEAGGAPAFWPWIQIFRSMLRDPHAKGIAGAYGDVLARLLPELRKESGEVAARELDQAQARFQLFDEVWALLRAMAEQVPLVVVLDDLHAADPSSLALLQFIVRDLRANRVVVLVTYRDREAKPTADVSEAIRAIAREGTFLPLGRLTSDEVARLLDDRAGKAVPRELAAALHKATEGNPLFVDQIYRTLEARGALDAPPTALPIPEGMREVIRGRLDALDASTRSLVEAAAVIGREFTRALLAAASGRDEASLLVAMKNAIDAGIFVEPVLGAFEFSHALFREVLYRDLPAGERATLHARAAEALEASSAPDQALGEVAQHLLEAFAVVGPERAAEGAMRAGRRALDVLAFEDAATIVSAALDRLGPRFDPRVRAQAFVMLGEAEARLGRHDAARRACEEAAAIARRLDDATLLAEAALALGVELMPGVIVRALVNLLEEARRALPDRPTPLRARVLARLAAAQQPAPNPIQPIELAREAVAMARGLADDATLRACLAMGGAALAEFADPSERAAWNYELLRLSTQADDPMAALRARSRLFFDYLELGQVPEADAQVEEHQRLADRLGLQSYQWLTLMMRALRAIWDGRFADAIDLRERARRVGQRVLTPEMEMSTLLQGFGMAIARGEPLPGVDRVAALGARFPASEFMTLVTHAFEEVRHGSTETARQLVSQISVESPMLSCLGPHVRCLIETCTRLDDRARAARLRSGIAPYEGRMATQGRVGLFVEGPISWLLGMLAGVLEEWDEAARLFEMALEQCTRLGMKPYEAITCLEYARVLARRGGGFAELRAELLLRGSTIAKELEMTGIAREFDLEMGTARAVVGAPPVEASKAASDRETGPPAFSLGRDGEVWALQTGRGTFRLKDSRGMQILAELTEHPNREFHVLTLMGAEVSDGDSGEVIDREAARAYRARAEDLKVELEEAEAFGDAARAERARAELESISDELAAAFGLGGRSRRVGAAAERARINVQRRLREAIRRIAEQDPKLGRYLDRAVRTGSFCAYEPD